MASLLTLLMPAALGLFAGYKSQSRSTAILIGIIAGIAGSAAGVWIWSFNATTSEEQMIVEDAINSFMQLNNLGLCGTIGLVASSLGYKRRKDKERQKQLMEEINQAQE